MTDKVWSRDELVTVVIGARAIARDRRAMRVPFPEALPVSPGPVYPDWVDEINTIHPNDRAEVVDRWWEVVSSPGEIIDVEASAQDPAGDWYRDRIRYINLLHQPEYACILVVIDHLEPIDRPPDAINTENASFEEALWCVQELDTVGIVQQTNGTVEALFGEPPSALVGQSILDHIHPDDRTAAVSMWLEVLGEPGATRTIEYRIMRSDGSSVWVASTVTNQLEWLGFVLSITHDISSQRKRAAELVASERALRFLTESVPVGVFRADGRGTLVVTNERFRELFASAETLDEVIDELDPAQRAEVVALFGRTAHNDETQQLRVRSADRQRFYELRARGLVDDNQPESGVLIIGTIDDVTVQEHRTFELRATAERDPLTGIANRRGIARALGLASASDPDLVVVFGDLDSFKVVNDTHGHEAGDEVLRTVATRLQQAVRPGDVVGRWGGDEFVIVCREVRRDSESEVLDRLHAAVAREVELPDGATYAPSVSFGAVRPDEGESNEDVLRRADTAMYDAKWKRHG